MNTLRYSPEALNDLDEIWAYIHNELHNPAAAKKTVLSILDTVEKLRDFSELGASLTAIMPVDSDYRYLVVKHVRQTVRSSKGVNNSGRHYRKLS